MDEDGQHTNVRNADNKPQGLKDTMTSGHLRFELRSAAAQRQLGGTVRFHKGGLGVEG